jgi:organic hydroperoxide reductase OsmC/OhrA
MKNPIASALLASAMAACFAVTVRSAAHQLTVTVTDSSLVGALEREAQASRIAAAI